MKYTTFLELQKPKDNKEKSKLDRVRSKLKSKKMTFSTGKKITNLKSKEASEEQLKARAMKNARRRLSKELMGKIYDDLTAQQRIEFNNKKKNQQEKYKRYIDDEYHKLKKEKNKKVTKRIDKTKG